MHKWFEDHHNFYQARGTGSPALEAAAGWWRRGAQQQSRGSARQLRALVRRRPWPELLQLRSGHARQPFLRRPRLQAGRRRGGPAGRRPRVLPRAASSSLSPQLFFSSTPPLFLRRTEKSPWVAARHREMLIGAAGFIGWRLGFRGRGSGRLGCGTGGTRWPSAAASAAGGRRPWGRRGCLRRLPCPHGVVTGKTTGRKGEGGGKKGLTGGPHMAVTKRRGGW
jgi:hypothetical protein